MEKLFAFFAAILFAVQPWFFEQMPALNRQEIAFIAFAMVLFVIFDPRLGKKIKQILLYFFVAMLLVAHYSTFYVWVALIIAVFAVSGIMYPFKRLRQPFRIITPAVFIMSLIGIFIWQFFLTNTAGHLQEVITNQASTSTISTTTSGSAATQSNSSIRGGAETALYVGINSNTTESLTLAEQSAINSDLSVEGYETYPASSTATYNPTLISEPINAPTIIPGYINSFINILILLSRFIATELLPIIGILWLLWIFQKHRDDDRREDLGVFGLGAILIIGIMVLVPYLQTYYNLTRLYLQMFLILSTLAIIGGIAATRYIPHRRVLILSILMAIVLCGSSGALDQLIGGEKSMIFDQPPANLDAPYIYDGEVSSAMWLTANYNPNDPVQADIISNLRLQSFSKIDTFNFDIFPATIEPQSYVYLDKKNIQGEAFYQYNNNLLTYSYPLDFLNSQKNLIYNNGDSRIYH